MSITFIRPKRNMAGFIADAVIEERHSDSLVITDHPVEQGATISDHAYKRPAELTLDYEWSAGGGQGSKQDLSTLYQQLLQLQVDRVLFDVVTGKRQYTNMLLETISVDTDFKKEFVLSVRAVCREVLIAKTQFATLSDSAVQLLPQSTGPVVGQGTVSLAPATNYNTGVPPQ